MQNSIQLIIFDCDGVLIDSEILASRHEASAAKKLGFNISTEEVCEKFTGLPSKFFWQYIGEKIGQELSQEFISQQIKDMHDSFATDLSEIKNVRAALETITLPICVASTTRLDNLKENLHTTNLISFFGDNVFSASQVSKPKPAPDVYLFAAKNMGIEPKNCLAIEDSEAGMIAATTAGIRTIGFLGGSHIQKGRHYTEQKAKLLNAGAIDIFDDFSLLDSMLSKYL